MHVAFILAGLSLTGVNAGGFIYLLFFSVQRKGHARPMVLGLELEGIDR